MSILSKKTNIVHNITYMAIMAAINFVFIVLATYLPASILILVILLPLASAIVAYFCLKRYYLIYAVAAISLCLFINIIDTIFYIVPAILTGFVVGLLLEKKSHPFWMILSASVIQSILTYFFIPLINLISGTDFVLSILTIFKLQHFIYQEEITHLFIFFISFAQSILMVFVLTNEISKVGIKIQSAITSFFPYIFGLLLCLIFTVALSLVKISFCFVFLAISFYFTILLLFDLLNSKNTYLLIGVITAFIISFFLVVILYKYLVAPYGLVLLVIFPFFVSLLSFFKYCLVKTTTLS